MVKVYVRHLGENEKNHSMRWRLIKRLFSIEMNTHGIQKTIWQRRFWEHCIRDEDDWKAHMDYIHYNPVKHGYVNMPSDYQHSSFHYWKEKGLYEKEWGIEEPRTFSQVRTPE
jgi:putative transposase